MREILKFMSPMLFYRYRNPMPTSRTSGAHLFMIHQLLFNLCSRYCDLIFSLECQHRVTRILRSYSFSIYNFNENEQAVLMF